MNKINFGCAYYNLPGWINIDNSMRHILVSKIPKLPKVLYKLGFLTEPVYKAHIQKKYKNVIYADIRRELQFKNNSVDFIYCSHVLEHLYKDKAIFFLTECLRILKDGGIIRLLTPDIEYEASKYLSSLPSIDAVNKFSSIIYAATCKHETKNGHKWMYDKVNLSKLLRDVGFSEINIGQYKKGNFPDVSKLDNNKESLIMEACK